MAAGLVGLAPTAVAEGPPIAPHTAYTAHFDGWGVEGNGTFSFEASRNILHTYQQTSNGYALAMAGYTNDYKVTTNLNVSPPNGTRFVAGQSYPAISAFNTSDTTTVINVSNHYECGATGTVNVLEAVYDDATGQFTAFAADYSLQCPNSNGLVKGEIRFKSSLDYRTADAWDYPLGFWSQPVGEAGTPQQVKVEVNGTLPTTFGAATLEGANPDAFRITANGCTGQTLSYGQVCELTVIPFATAVGQQSAVLALANDTFAGRITRGLSVEGYRTARGTYHSLKSFRILDTRSGKPQGRLNSGQTLPLRLTGAGVDAAASTVVLNVTVTDSYGSGFLSVYPTGVPRPTVSSLNFTHGWTGANSVTVKLGADGAINLYNGGAAAHVIVDVIGYYSKPQPYGAAIGGQYQPLRSPVRLTDTREWGQGRIPADHYIYSYASFGGSVNGQVRALAVNITSTDSRGPGFLTAWNGIDEQMPNTSTLNFGAGRSVPNFAIVPVSRCGADCGGATDTPRIGVYTNNDSHIIVDIVGFYDDGTLSNGLRFEPNVPTRITDTRTGQGWSSALGTGATATIDADAVANDDTYALATNVTAVLPTESTYVTVWPAGLSGVGRPGTSNLNPTAGSIVPNAVQTLIGPGNRFNIYNNTGKVDIVVDVVGTFYIYPPSQPMVTNELATPKAIPQMQINRA
ncbi:hypothetical protein [Actinokineospora xionganensis]|uniref:Uncharacterized protein n=1 Tax=Actinokineospora xionganensis TaxID=2684470 RepID=A0ABR7L3N9_9PSEU|nr:hypothetical protein [Actinokineospora xionganensis]MBC6446962.1 hypothetical protein [Actinokineospora xionganensis]